jgi:hypothetical protein
MIASFRAAPGVRQWAAGIGLAGAALVAAATIGTAGASVARADTPDEVMAQAAQDLTQATSLLDAADTTDLSARQMEILTAQESLLTEITPLLTKIGSAQEALSPADQTFLADIDDQWVIAAQNVYSADQAFVAADQAGELSNTSYFLPVDWTVLDANLGLLSADFNTLGATLLAVLDPDIGSLLGAFDPGSVLP